VEQKAAKATKRYAIAAALCFICGFLFRLPCPKQKIARKAKKSCPELLFIDFLAQ